MRVAYTNSYGNQATGARLKEGIGINQSLSTLSRVISDLATKGGKALPPFRESKLTLLLKDARRSGRRRIEDRKSWVEVVGRFLASRDLW